MGIWSKLKKALTVTTMIAPALPIPDKAKKVIAKTGEIEQDAEDLVRELKKPAPPQ